MPAKEIVLNVLVGLIKLTSAITLIAFSAISIGAADDVQSGTHPCSGDTSTLVDSLKGETGEGTLAAAAAAMVLLDLIGHGVNTSLGLKWNYWGIVDKLQHGVEFIILALSASVLHTLDLSNNDGGLQYLFKKAGCGDDYTAVLPNGLALVAVSFLATLVQFLILRVKILAVVRQQGHFNHITGDNCDTD